MKHGAAAQTPGGVNRPGGVKARAFLPAFNKGAFYRQCRMLHGYFSAMAFITLIFFSVTGLLLNHPEWLGPARTPQPASVVQLDMSQVTAALEGQDPGRLLAEVVRAATPLRGAFHDAELFGDEAYLRFVGVNGASDVVVDLTSGAADVETRRANLTAIMHDLHRGKDAGGAWKLFIDASAVVILAMSLIGFVLFFSLRLRLATSLKLVTAGAALLIGIVVFGGA